MAKTVLRTAVTVLLVVSLLSALMAGATVNAEETLQITNMQIIRISETQCTIEFDSNGHGDMYIDHRANDNTIAGVFMREYAPGHNSFGPFLVTVSGMVADEIRLSAWPSNEDHSWHADEGAWEETYPIPAYDPSLYYCGVAISVGTVTDLDTSDNKVPDQNAIFDITITMVKQDGTTEPFPEGGFYLKDSLQEVYEYETKPGVFGLKSGQITDPNAMHLSLFRGVIFNITLPSSDYVLNTSNSTAVGKEIPLAVGSPVIGAFNFTFGSATVSSGDTTLMDGTTNIAVRGEIENGVTLSAAPVTSGANFTLADGALKDPADKFTLFDIALIKDGVKVQPNGKVLVSIPVPQGYDGSKCKVYRIEADGGKTDMNASLKSGRLEFEADHFSLYAVAQVKSGSGTTTTTTTGNTGNISIPKTGDDSKMTVYVALMLLSVAGVVALVLAGRKRTRNKQPCRLMIRTASTVSR
ncbi:MAG: LPXTG cell wall anchor domain-containing protein [Oscillospiraceae bacterium]|jgi:LPXTG-motif cell wall-anchored protein|nr:LPXTG cell wall anchor domain-containing protein [Oscillospiraceae bacterium]